MSDKRSAGSLQAKVIEHMQEDPKGLWTKHDVMEVLDVEERPAENALYNAWRLGRISKHTDNCPETKLQRYALKIPPAKAATYQKREGHGAASTNIKKRKKGSMPSAREIRTMFAQTQNQMAKMEDMMVAVVEEAETLEKMMNKIRNISNL